MYTALAIAMLLNAGAAAAEPPEMQRYAHPELPRCLWELGGGEVRYSPDGGATWRRLLKRPGLVSILGDPLRPQRVYFSTNQNTYVSDDGWHVRGIGGPREGGRLAFDSIGRLYVAAHLGQRPGVWRFSEGAWDRLLGEPIGSVMPDPNDPRHMLAIVPAPHGLRIWRSTDDGLSWARPRLPGEPSHLPLTRRYTHDAADADYATSQELLPALVIVRNASMTEGETAPAGWFAHGDVALTRDTGFAASLPASLQAQAGSGGGYVSQRIVAPGPTRLRVKAMAAARGGEAQLLVRPLDRNESVLASHTMAAVAPAADWGLAEGEYQLPEGTVAFYLGLQLPPLTTAWLDDVQIDVRLGGQWMPAATVLDEHGGAPGELLDASLVCLTPVPGYFPNFPRGWADWHERLVQRPRLDSRVVFLGDSFAEQWRLYPDAWKPFEQYNASNYGITGDRTQNILWRLNHDALAAGNPEVIVLHAGADNLEDRRLKPLDIAAGVDAICGRIAELQPQASLLVVSIPPRGTTLAHPMRARVSEINRHVLAMCQRRQIRYIEVAGRLLEVDGSLSTATSPDGVGFSAAGYARMAGVLAPAVEEALQPTSPRP